MNNRTKEITRTTKETSITADLNLDGSGKYDIKSGIGFFDHMLELFAKHGLFDLSLTCNGDINVDGHHTVEDTGIVLGKCIKGALGDKKSIKRYGSIILPMDEVLVLAALDLGGRPYFSYNVDFSAASVGAFDTELLREFFYALSMNAEINLHIKLLSENTGNAHHICEGVFKAFAKSLDAACQRDSRIDGIMSTKGMLDM